MFRILPILVAFGLSLFAASAEAGHRSGYLGYGHGHGAFVHRGYRGFPHRRFGRSHRRTRLLVGGLVAGALIGHAIHRSADRRRSGPPPVSTTYPESDSWYFRDRHGNCFWVEQDVDGGETRTAVDPAECDW